jgi:hypothetical protein
LELATPSVQDIERLNRVASGQRLMVLSVLVSFFAGPLRGSIGDAALVIGIAATIMAIVGAVRLAGALGNSIGMRIVYAVLMIVPLVNLITMLFLSSRATKQLREAGYRVGLLGASSR